MKPIILFYFVWYSYYYCHDSLILSQINLFFLVLPKQPPILHHPTIHFISILNNNPFYQCFVLYPSNSTLSHNIIIIKTTNSAYNDWISRNPGQLIERKVPSTFQAMHPPFSFPFCCWVVFLSVQKKKKWDQNQSPIYLHRYHFVTMFIRYIQMFKFFPGTFSSCAPNYSPHFVSDPFPTFFLLFRQTH